MDIGTIVNVISTGVSAITVLKQGYDWITGSTFDQRFERFSAQITDQLEEIRNGVYRLPVQEVYDPSYTVQRVVRDARQIGAAVEPIHRALAVDMAVSNPIATPDKFRATFAQNPEDLLHRIHRLEGGPLPSDYLSDPTLRPVIFEKWGAHFIGLLKVGYARDYLNLEYRPMTEAPAELAAPVVPQVRRSSEPPTKTSRIDFDWVTIPAGEFLYGEKKQRVYLDAFRVMRTPVTNAQYKVFVDATNHRPPRYWQGNMPPAGKERHPVVNVSWDDAQALCAWAGARLPTEQEWEKAARGTDGREFPWGNEKPDARRANYGMQVHDTTEVGRYPAGASPYGVLDMAGNVWEWCEDLWEPGSEGRAVRGGSWGSDPVFLRAAYRDWFGPVVRYFGLGVRLFLAPR